MQTIPTALRFLAPALLCLTLLARGQNSSPTPPTNTTSATAPNAVPTATTLFAIPAPSATLTANKKLSFNDSAAQALLDKANYKGLVRMTFDDANNGQPRAQVWLGRIAQNGWGAVIDGGVACQWFNRAAEAGDSQGQFYFGQCWQHGLGGSQSFNEAERWYLKAAEAGQVEAAYRLGEIALQGLLNQGEADKKTARNWLERAASKGHRQAQLALAMLLEQGDVRDREAALKWYQQAATAGIKEAQYNLGNHYLTLKQTEAALKWFQQAAEGGDSRALYQLARLYLGGQIAGKGAADALPLLEKAADTKRPAPLPEAATLIAQIKLNEGNASAALPYLNQAAQAGQREAAFLLGRLYLKGEGGVRNDRLKAEEWLTRAARQNLPEAQYSLYLINKDQLGDEAIYWLQRAANNNYPPAKQALDEYLKK